jgi:hypothetical protein
MCVVCVLCLIVVPLPPGENPFAVKINIYYINQLFIVSYLLIQSLIHPVSLFFSCAVSYYHQQCCISLFVKFCLSPFGYVFVVTISNRKTWFCVQAWTPRILCSNTSRQSFAWMKETLCLLMWSTQTEVFWDSLHVLDTPTFTQMEENRYSRAVISCPYWPARRLKT